MARASNVVEFLFKQRGAKAIQQSIGGISNKLKEFTRSQGGKNFLAGAIGVGGSVSGALGRVTGLQFFKERQRLAEQYKKSLKETGSIAAKSGKEQEEAMKLVKDGLIGAIKLFLRFKVAFAVVAGAVAAVGTIVAAAFKVVRSSITPAAEQERSLNRLNVALGSIGGFSRDASANMQSFAAQMQRTTKFSDQAVLSASGLIAQLGRITGRELQEATQNAVNLASALDRDLKTAALIVAKAAQGSTFELRKYGLVIDNSIPKAERFAVVQQFLRDTFGGVAASEMRTFTATTLQLGNAWNQVKEAIGEPLIIRFRPTLQSISQQLLDVAAAIKKAFESDTPQIELTGRFQELLEQAKKAQRAREEFERELRVVFPGDARVGPEEAFPLRLRKRLQAARKELEKLAQLRLALTKDDVANIAVKTSLEGQQQVFKDLEDQGKQFAEGTFPSTVADQLGRAFAEAIPESFRKASARLNLPLTNVEAQLNKILAGSEGRALIGLDEQFKSIKESVRELFEPDELRLGTPTALQLRVELENADALNAALEEPRRRLREIQEDYTKILLSPEVDLEKLAAARDVFVKAGIKIAEGFEAGSVVQRRFLKELVDAANNLDPLIKIRLEFVEQKDMANSIRSLVARLQKETLRGINVFDALVPTNRITTLAVELDRLTKASRELGNIRDPEKLRARYIDIQNTLQTLITQYPKHAFEILAWVSRSEPAMQRLAKQTFILADEMTRLAPLFRDLAAATRQDFIGSEGIIRAAEATRTGLLPAIRELLPQLVAMGKVDAGEKLEESFRKLIADLETKGTDPPLLKKLREFLPVIEAANEELVKIGKFAQAEQGFTLGVQRQNLDEALRDLQKMGELARLPLGPDPKQSDFQRQINERLRVEQALRQLLRQSAQQDDLTPALQKSQQALSSLISELASVPRVLSLKVSADLGDIQIAQEQLEAFNKRLLNQDFVVRAGTQFDVSAAVSLLKTINRLDKALANLEKRGQEGTFAEDFRVAREKAVAMVDVMKALGDDGGAAIAQARVELQELQRQYVELRLLGQSGADLLIKIQLKAQELDKIEEAVDAARTAQQNIRETLQSGLQNILTAPLTSMLDDTRSFAETMRQIFRDMVNDIANELARLAVRTVFADLINKVAGGATGGIFGAIIEGITRGGGGKATGPPFTEKTTFEPPRLVDTSRPIDVLGSVLPGSITAPEVSINVNANDTGSVARSFKRGSLLRAVDRAVRYGV